MTDEMSDLLPWVDTETNGLGDDTCCLELGLVVTDGRLNELWSHSWLVAPPYSMADLVLTMDPYVLEMHNKNGLLQDLHEVYSRGEMDGPHTIEMQAITLLAQAGISAGMHPMCGSTPHFDRALIRRVMPKLESYFHYRNIDISSIKELCKIWYPGVYAERPGKDDADKKHRVLDDVRASIAELKYYIEAGFIAGPLKEMDV